MKTLTCPICDGAMRVKAAKNGKPFADCKADGLQLLIRTHEGTDRFTARYGSAWKGGAPAPAAAPAKPAAAPVKKTATAAPAKKVPEPAAAVPKKRGLFDL